MNRFIYYVTLLLVTATACKKEAELRPGNTEENYLVVMDNPSDSVDHAIYLFYQATGVPVYYNDTIARRQVGDSAGIPRYFYHKLATSYSPAGRDIRLFVKLLEQKEKVMPMLPFLQTQLLPRIPASIPAHSLLLVDSIRVRGNGAIGSSTTTNKPYIGFNTIILKTVVADTMEEAGRKKYVASVLAAMALKRLVSTYSQRISTEFHSISINSAPGMSVYGTPLSTLSPDGSLQLEDFGFITRNPTNLFEVFTPLPQDDLLAFLEAVFFYETASAFEPSYTRNPLVLNKFKIIRNMAQEIGFRFAD